MSTSEINAALQEAHRALLKVRRGLVHLAGIQAALPVRTCGCGRAFTAAQWGALPGGKVQRDPEDPMELRHCPCGSSLLVSLALLAAVRGGR